MKITSITEDHIGILIMIDNEIEYSIPKTAYSENTNGISDWIDDMLFKRWADKDSLYKIGSILSKGCTVGSVDWISTFENVEFFYDNDSNMNKSEINKQLTVNQFKM